MRRHWAASKALHVCVCRSLSLSLPWLSDSLLIWKCAVDIFIHDSHDFQSHAHATKTVNYNKSAHNAHICHLISCQRCPFKCFGTHSHSYKMFSMINNFVFIQCVRERGPHTGECVVFGSIVNGCDWKIWFALVSSLRRTGNSAHSHSDSV